MSSFERKFNVNPEGEAEEAELTEEEKEAKRSKQKKEGKYLGLVSGRRFIVDDKGNTTVEEGKDKLAVKRKDGSVEKIIE